MRRRWLFLAAGTCSFCYVASAAAQVAPADGSAQPASNSPNEAAQDTNGVASPPATNANSGDIVVTARRRSESLQNVPQTVDVVSGSTIEKLSLTQFQDVATIVPGLSLATAPSGSSPAPTLRGVTFDANASPSPTIDVYINEAPSSVYDVFRAIYDLGDVQVLRGPQGTLRGRTAPSGAILLNLRKGDTNDTSGYVNFIGTEKGSINAQGAVNVPLVKGLLGLRVAGLGDETDGNFVRSASGGPSPYRSTYSGRASLAFTPSSNLRADLMFQYLNVKSKQYVQVAGAGSLGGLTPLAPAGYNGPVISADDRLAVEDTPTYNNSRSKTVVANVTWTVLGHQLQYIGSYGRNHNVDLTSQDIGNSLTGRVPLASLDSQANNWSHEVRLSSDGTSQLLDYSLGYFHSIGRGKNRGIAPAAALPGAFGSPANPDPAIFNSAFVLPSFVQSDSRAKEDSVYANATLHLGARTELTGGGRYIIKTRSQINLNVFLGGGAIAIPNPIAPFPCVFAGFVETYPGFCDVNIPASSDPIITAVNDRSSHPFVFNASLTHRLSDDFTVYGTVGSSWRQGGFNISITDSSNDPALRSLLFGPNETSTSYELGVKGALMDRRLHFSVAGFYQRFKNLAFQVTSVPYVTSNGQTSSVASTFINVGADATTKGIDFNSTFQASRSFSIGLAASYANGRVDNDAVPCRDSNFDGVPDTGTPTLENFAAAGRKIAFCKTNQSVSRIPQFSTTLQSEYSVPVSSATDAYLRGYATYYTKNPFADIGNAVPSYVLVNLYAGLRSSDQHWDVGLFARNLAGQRVQLTRDPAFITNALNADATFGNSGYRVVSSTPPREVGLAVRYAFGR